MALVLKYPPPNNIGNIDVLDADLAGLKGGEVMGLTYLSITGTDLTAQDTKDGYVSITTKKRRAATRQLTSGMRPLFLCDTGKTGYGPLFGQTVGGSVGQQVINGLDLGPPVDYWSGKAALWDKEGIYAVTLDACDTNETTGLQPTNTTIAGNDALYATATGLLTPNVSSAFESVVVGRFMQFNTSNSLVTTPKSLQSALNAGGSALVGSPLIEAEFHWRIEG